MSLIEPRTLKGFRDYLPEVMMPREALIATAQSVYRSFGYSPIDTPALEYFEVLAGKGSDETDRQMYVFEDHGGRKIGMRFDLTVPLARFAAQHANELGLPFKRYHIGTVWRGENTQRGLSQARSVGQEHGHPACARQARQNRPAKSCRRDDCCCRRNRRASRAG